MANLVGGHAWDRLVHPVFHTAKAGEILHKHAVAPDINAVGGKPLFSGFFAFPVAYELTILLGAFGSLGGMFILNRLPRHHHPLLTNDRFAAATDDKFFVVIECVDPGYDEASTRALLEASQPDHIEMVEDTQ